jgi:hypothetical protein
VITADPHETRMRVSCVLQRDSEFDSKALAIGLAKISAKIRGVNQQQNAAELADIGKRKPKKVKRYS